MHWYFPYPFLTVVNQLDAASSMTFNQLIHELDNFITQQQQLHDTIIALTIHQLLTHSASTSESSTPSAHFEQKQSTKSF